MRSVVRITRINPAKPSPCTPAKYQRQNRKPELDKAPIRPGESGSTLAFMSKTERQKYKIAGPATWELIRAAYLGGESAPAVAERFGVGEHAIRKRITVEKWTKRDYAAALEARGIAPRQKPKLNYVEEGVVREQARVAAETAAEVGRDAEIHAWIEKVAAEEEARDIADALERRALAQAGAAMVQGRSKDAQALASLAEQMRKRSDHERAHAKQPAAGARAGEAPEVEIDDARRADFVDDMFARVAFLAGAMLHAPSTAPAVFVGMIREWRQINLGEDEADAEAAGRRVAEAQAAYLSGDWLEATPMEFRARMQTRWAEQWAQGAAAVASED